MLADKRLPIKEIAIMVGHANGYSFSKAYNQYHGVSPKFATPET